MAIIAIIQTILHYLGWLGILLGVGALMFSNKERGFELISGGVGFIVVKYIIGFSYVMLTQGINGIKRGMRKKNE